MNQDDISKLWDAITPKLYGYLVKTLRDADLARDILQNTWLKALENLSQFKGGDKDFSSWLFMIARNECKQYWRKGGREVYFDPSLHDVADESTEGSDLFVDQLIGKLPKEDQELIRLRYVGGLPYEDIAKILHTNQVAVRVRAHRSIKALRTALQNQL